jgi:prolyl-tRNA editing enzyme YbaK/EbsC (Cys-tRNA(Pro) deacylase)
MPEAGQSPPEIQAILENAGFAFEVIACDPDLADTAVFCKEYGYDMDQSANTILVKSKTGERKFAACIVLANCRLDVNKTVRKRLGARKVSFATPEETRELTGMVLGGVTPFNLPDDLPLWVDGRVMDCDKIILGGGNRSSKIIVDPAILPVCSGAEIIDGLANPVP